MSTLLDHYKILGVNVGAGIADVTSSYRQLCRLHHPDVSDDPDAEELMKQINIAYTVLRDKFKRETAFRERQTYTRPTRRYGSPEARQQGAESQQQETEKEAREALLGYFKAINAFDFTGAYNYLSEHDKKYISQESFIDWRESVARLYPMREFKIAGGSSIAVVTWGDDKTFHARKFRVIITEDDYSDDATQSGDVDKLVINEDGKWGVYLGYKSVGELTRTFDERLQSKRRRDIAKRWEEYYTGLYQEFDMLNMDGMRRSVSRELYRHRRFGGSITFAAISIKHSGAKRAGEEELLRSAARTICGELRETDIPAYAGDGVFAIMFVELRRKDAEEIIKRLAELIRKNAGQQLGREAAIEYAFDTWSGNSYADFDNINNVLKIFSKKM